MSRISDKEVIGTNNLQQTPDIAPDIKQKDRAETDAMGKLETLLSNMQTLGKRNPQRLQQYIESKTAQVVGNKHKMHGKRKPANLIKSVKKEIFHDLCENIGIESKSNIEKGLSLFKRIVVKIKTEQEIKNYKKKFAKILSQNQDLADTISSVIKGKLNEGKNISNNFDQSLTLKDLLDSKNQEGNKATIAQETSQSRNISGIDTTNAVNDISKAEGHQFACPILKEMSEAVDYCINLNTVVNSETEITRANELSIQLGALYKKGKDSLSPNEQETINVPRNHLEKTLGLLGADQSQVLAGEKGEKLGKLDPDPRLAITFASWQGRFLASHKEEISLNLQNCDEVYSKLEIPGKSPEEANETKNELFEKLWNENSKDATGMNRELYVNQKISNIKEKNTSFTNVNEDQLRNFIDAVLKLKGE